MRKHATLLLVLLCGFLAACWEKKETDEPAVLQDPVGHPTTGSEKPDDPAVPENPQQGNAGFEVQRSKLQREERPEVPQGDQTQLAANNTTFALELYKSLATKEGSLFFSPLSLTFALAMTYAGAKGETATQMAGALRFTLPPARLHAALNLLDLSLRGATVPEAGEARGFSLHFVNALWGQREYPFLTPFLDLLALHYGAGMHLVDFKNATEAARQAINTWVLEQTERRIEELIPPDILVQTARLVLTNAVYFYGPWEEPFEKEATVAKPFHPLQGAAYEVPMMQNTEHYQYRRGKGYQAIELPYTGEPACSMLVLVPDAGTFLAFEADLSPKHLTSILADMRSRYLELELPKFRLAGATFSVKQQLEGLGMVLPFTTSADFTGMTEASPGLYIGDVLHKAFIAVDEDGTEAAAATAVIMMAGSAMPLDEKIVLHIDRPFLFLIRERTSGAILFLGRMLDPR
ncbi:MAG: hypothetical protein A2284_17040 [Deltaproteobacteria bacterium RIFOXYA12_FULL_61_11]|nr:MAG: hypothetical protein A2284_17040 [Deltaproteobacteria bacterium RIFOXYA12_FULL_61_11]